MERQIQVRDSGSSPERQDASERSMERAGGLEGAGMVRQLEAGGKGEELSGEVRERGGPVGGEGIGLGDGWEYSGIIYDTEGCNSDGWNTVISYSRPGEAEPLGSSQAIPHEDTAFSRTSRSCFNCSSPDHVVTSCPEPRDPARILAAREARGLSLSGEGNWEHPDYSRRYFSIPLWRNQRLEWVDKFRPGRIVGEELREAVGLPKETPPDVDSEAQDCVPWLDGGNAEGSCGGMMFWGYPPGWIGPLDPRELMRERIVSRPAPIWEGIDQGPVTFTLYEEGKAHIIEFETQAPPSSPPLKKHSPNRRWARYQTTLFSSDRLTISNVECPLPPVPKPPEILAKSTPTDRKELWARLVAGQNNGQSEMVSRPRLPWRQPGAFNWGVPY